MLILLVLLVWKFLWPRIFYNIRAFSGDGQITDTGFWSYPRYHVEFRNVPINERSTTKFSFSGVPAEAFSFKLRIGSAADSRLLEDNLDKILDKITVRVSLKDQHGNVICEASDSLRKWYLTSSQIKECFWHNRCRDVRLSHTAAYTLEVKVDPAATDLPKILLKPVLEGGGNETL